MAKGFKKGAGGVNPLNFMVVGGTTQPSNPRENTIWINTGKEITSWIFSFTEPPEPSEGMIWIRVGSLSTFKFNALKKNNIQVCPISAKQYVSGAYVDVAAQSYQGGEWGEWLLYLFNSGDECLSVTGGWSSSAYNLSDKNTAPTLTISGSTMTIAFKSYTAGATHSQNTYYNGSVWTEDVIDFTDMSTLTVEVDSVRNASGDYFQLHLVSDKKSGFASASVASLSISTAGKHVLDTSSLKGSYYVVFVNSNSKSSMTVAISKILTNA